MGSVRALCFDEATELLYIREYAKDNRFDVVVMDTAPTGESLKLLYIIIF